MRRPIAWSLVTLCALAAVGAAPPPEEGRALVASDHPLASAAGVEVLKAGGNAVDAAVAAALSAGVVQPRGSGLGGGGFAVLHLEAQPGTALTLDFREVGPRGITPAAYRDESGAVDGQRSRVGGLAVAVPGEPIGLATLVEAHGALSLKAVAAPAIRQASRGFPLGAHLAHGLVDSPHEEVRALFGLVDPRPGQLARNPALGRTLQRWASSGGRYLHEGVGAQAIVDEVSGAGGVMETADLSEYAPKERAPIVSTFRGYTIVSMGPPSSGGIALAQVLAALEPDALAPLGHNSSAYIHRVVEAMKHAYADRAAFMGDPDFVEVPVERLLGAERIAEIRAKLDAAAHPPEHYGDLTAPARHAGTQHISVIDEAGNAVALTTTINTSFGSGLVVEDLGVVLNNEMDDFSLAPGVPNAYGLVGSSANAVAPGKRPLSSMTPTLVLDAEGDVVMAVGASGGSFIISATLQVILDVLVFDMDPQEAVAAPRFHHQWAPDTLFLEPDFPRDVVVNLQARGHEVTVRDGFSSVQVVVAGPEHLEGGADPRKGGWPASTW